WLSNYSSLDTCSAALRLPPLFALNGNSKITCAVQSYSSNRRPCAYGILQSRRYLSPSRKYVSAPLSCNRGPQQSSTERRQKSACNALYINHSSFTCKIPSDLASRKPRFQR